MTYWWEERLRRADRGQRRHRHEQLSRRAMRPEQPGCLQRVRLGAEREARSGIGQQRPHPSASCLWSRLLVCPDAVSRMSPRLRRNCGGSRGTLRTLIYLATYCAFDRIDELACVVALLAISPRENSSPVHPVIPRPGIPC